MRNFGICRRTFISTTAIVCLTALGIVHGLDVSYAIATVAVGLASANAYEGSKRPKS